MTKLTVIIPVWNQEVLVKRALKSIPLGCEIIVIDDGSTDGTLQTIQRFRYGHPQADIKVLRNKVNRGVSVALNKGLDAATGEYITILGSDDYFHTDRLNHVIAKIDGTDLIYYDLSVNDGTLWRLSPETKGTFCGSVKLMRRAFVGDTRNHEDKRVREDWFFYHDLMDKDPTEKFTHIIAKHYNWPRVGSLTNLGTKEVDDER